MVADFGVATAVRTAGGENAYITDHGFAVGTPAYEPEQASAESGLDGRTDQYSPPAFCTDARWPAAVRAGPGPLGPARDQARPHPGAPAQRAGRREQHWSGRWQVAGRPLPSMVEF